jgi:hypothetical protein
MFNLMHQRRFDSVDLTYGSHKRSDDGMCAMEMVAFLAGETHSDHPDCACPVLTGFTIRLNDSMPHEWRRQLKPYLPLLIGTRDNHEVARAEVLAWRAVRTFLPIALEACHLPERAARFRAFEGGLDRAADAAYAAYGALATSPAGKRVVNATRLAAMATARAAYAGHMAGAARAPHLGQAIEAADAADVAIAVTRVAEPDAIWALALETLDAAIAIGAEERATASSGPRLRSHVEA